MYTLSSIFSSYNTPFLFVHTQQDGFTPLMVACSNGHLEVANVLVKEGVSINLQREVHDHSQLCSKYLKVTFTNGYYFAFDDPILQKR